MTVSHEERRKRRKRGRTIVLVHMYSAVLGMVLCWVWRWVRCWVGYCAGYGAGYGVGYGAGHGVAYVLGRGDYLEASRQVGVVVEIGSGRIKKRRRRRRRREEKLNV